MKRATLFLSFIISSLIAMSQIGGDHTFQFLELPTASKVAALGGSQSVIWGDDLNMANQNPALLNNQMHGQINLNYVGYYADIKLGNIAYAHHFNRFGTFSLNVKSVHYGDFLYADEYGITSGTFSASETAYGIGWSYQIDSVFQFGLQLKGISSQLENYYSNGAAVDLGLVYHKEEKNFSAGIVMKNLGTQFQTYYTEAENEPLPFEIEASLSKKLAHAPFRVHLGFQHLEQLDLSYEDPLNPSETENPLTGEIEKESKFRQYSTTFLKHFIVGTEFMPSENFYVAVSYNAQRRAELKIDERKGLVGFSWGFGMNVKKFRFSYAQAIYHLVGPSHHFSLGVNLSSFYNRSR